MFLARHHANVKYNKNEDEFYGDKISVFDSGNKKPPSTIK